MRFNVKYKRYKSLYFWVSFWIYIHIKISICVSTQFDNQTRLAKCITTTVVLLTLIRSNVLYQTVVTFCKEFAMCSLLCFVESALHKILQNIDRTLANKYCIERFEYLRYIHVSRIHHCRLIFVAFKNIRRSK